MLGIRHNCKTEFKWENADTFSLDVSRQISFNQVHFLIQCNFAYCSTMYDMPTVIREYSENPTTLIISASCEFEQFKWPELLNVVEKVTPLRPF